MASELNYLGPQASNLAALYQMFQSDPGSLDEALRGFFGDLDVSRRFDRFRRFVHESPAAEIMATMLESTKINFFYDQLLVKEPGTSERTPWQYITYQ